MQSKPSRILEVIGGTGNFRAGLICMLTLSLLGTQMVPAFAKAPQTPDPAAVENQVKKWGVGKSVKMTLTSGEQVSGHIKTVGADSFTIKTGKPATERSISYAQVTEIKDPGPLTWILVGAAIVIVIILIAHH
jgi:hypothetical protein